MEQKDISTLTVNELKALGYDTLRELEIQKRNLATIESLIVEKEKKAIDGKGQEEGTSEANSPSE